MAWQQLWLIEEVIPVEWEWDLDLVIGQSRVVYGAIFVMGSVVCLR